MLLATKLHIPEPGSDYVSRPRLLERMQNTRDKRLVLISAPAGSGKSSLVEDWLRHTDINACWLSLDPQDNDPVRFLTYVVAALRQVDESIGHTAERMFASPNPPALTAVLTSFINDISDAGIHIAFVLDDFHLIEDQGVQDAVRFLVENQPPNFHLIITTRADPDLPLSRLRVRGQMEEIRAADLRFTSEETHELLRQTLAEDVGIKAAQTLEARTEGWAAGLQLAALSMHQQGNSQGFIDAFSGSHEYIIDYLTDEVLRGLSEDVVTFLLETSILDRFTADLCNTITGRTDSQQMLETLYEENLFLIPLDSQRRWFRYHHLFGSALHTRLEHQRTEQLKPLHLKASRWFAANDEPYAAIHHGLASKAYEHTAEVIEREGERILQQNLAFNEAPTLLDWINSLPDEAIQKYPRLNAFRAFALTLLADDQVELSVAEGYLKQVEHITVEQDAYAASIIRAVSGYIAFKRGDLDGAVEKATSALDITPPDQAVLKSGVLDMIGSVQWLRGDLQAARQAFEEGIREARTASTIYLELNSLHGLTEICREEGRLHQAADYYRQGLDAIDDNDLQSTHYEASFRLDLADAFREWNKLDEAEAEIQRSISIFQALSSDAFQGLGYAVLSRIQQAQGDFPAAKESQQAAQKHLRDVDVLGYRSWVDALTARLHLQQGKVSAARRWIRENRLDFSDPAVISQYPGETTTYVRCLIAESDYETVLHILSLMQEHVEESGRYNRLIEVLILKAIVLSQSSDFDAGLEALMHALDLAEPEGFVRSFLDEGEPVLNLLRHASREGSGYANILLKDTHHISQPNQMLVEPLSERELDVLYLIAEGKKNKEIAEDLIIVLGTVKAHINNIYGKLGVRSRVEAISRARELGLLD